ncbi:MAG: enoyl-CoA hydratase/isomerase family protein [Gammaproteobacteria bacterium]|nr:enoyl-CoA hydratase/isomerase family protein [Gammaproteobacteria bacterium]
MQLSVRCFGDSTGYILRRRENTLSTTSTECTEMSDYKNLICETKGFIATVTFNRPRKMNALDSATLEEIEAVAHSFRDDAETRVVVFTGTGKHFSSGADLSPEVQPIDVNANLALRRRRARIGERAINAIYDMDQITIAAWNGGALGGGACLTTAMDFRVGADDCFMQYPEIEIGVNLMWKSLPLITHLAGPAKAKRLVAGGERIHAEELHSWGILDALVPRDELLRTAMNWAERYANLSPIPQQMIKQSVNAITSALDSAVMHMDVDQNLFSASTEDRREAIRSYLAKTKPTFTGN